MFPFANFGKRRDGRRSTPQRPITLESLEGRQMLSATPAVGGHDHGGGPHGGPGGGGPGGGGPAGTAVAFSLLPAAVQSGLTALATTDGLTDPTATTPVSLGNRDGVETYSVTLRSTGTVSTLTVDVAGNPVAAATQSTTTFAALTTAPAAEIVAIAAAENLTAPSSTTTVHVTTTAAGVVTYSVVLSRDSATTTDASTGSFDHGSAVTVDAAGNPVGNQQLPLSVFPAAVQTALTAGAPTGATALTSTSTVDVRTADGITTYAVQYTVGTTVTTVTVDPTGATVTPATHTTSTLAAVPTVAAAELQALATAQGYSGTLATTQSVDVYTEVGGTATLYAVTVSVTGTSSSTDSTATHDATIVVDASGNPTTLPMDGGSEPGGSPGGGDQGGSGGSSGTGTSTSSATSAHASGRRGPASNGRGSNPFAAAAAADSPATPTLGPALALFASVVTNTTVAADLATLTTDEASLRSTIKGLSTADAATLRTDEKAVGAAVKAVSATTAADRATVRTDTAKYAATIRTDEAAIRKDAADATALSADQTQLATDQAAALAALSADLDALKAVVSADAGVTAAQSKLAADLPTVAAAQATVQSAYTQLVTDIGSAI